MSTITQELKAITQLAFPLIAVFIAQKGIQLVDVIMMGKIGAHALAAGALATSFLISVMVFCLGSLSATGVFISRSLGAKQLQEISSSLYGGFCLGALLAIPGMLLIWHAPALFLAVGEDPHIVAGSQLFLNAIVWGFPGLMGFFVMREFVSAFAFTKIIFWISVLAIPITAVANYIFIYGISIYGEWKIPALGIAGIGYSGAIIQWLMFLSMLGYCLHHPILKAYIQPMRYFKKSHPRDFQWRKVFEMLYIGAPSGLL